MTPYQAGSDAALQSYAVKTAAQEPDLLSVLYGGIDPNAAARHDQNRYTADAYFRQKATQSEAPQPQPKPTLQQPTLPGVGLSSKILLGGLGAAALSGLGYGGYKLLTHKPDWQQAGVEKEAGLAKKLGLGALLLQTAGAGAGALQPATNNAARVGNAAAGALGAAVGPGAYAVRHGIDGYNRHGAPGALGGAVRGLTAGPLQGFQDAMMLRGNQLATGAQTYGAAKQVAGQAAGALGTAAGQGLNAAKTWWANR